jgi:hypothetical protein
MEAPKPRFITSPPSLIASPALTSWVLSVATTTTTIPAPPPVVSPPGASASEVAAWQQTAQCEEGGRNDPTFGYFGIYPNSWRAFGGARFATVAGQATQAEQVEIGMAIEGHPPDIGGCSGSW